MTLLLLSKKQKRFLKEKAHALKPVVIVGAKGLTEPVHAEINQALNDHELIKIKLAGCDKLTRDTLVNNICDQQSALFVQSIGRIVTVYRQAEKPKISLPKDHEKATEQ